MAQAASQAFKSAIQAAANVLDATFSNNISLNIEVGYGEYPGDGSSENGGGASAAPSTGIYESYSQVRSWLASNAVAAVQSGIFALPSDSKIQGQSQVAVWRAQEKLMGQISSNDLGIDGYAGFAADISSTSLQGVALHELTHAMSRINYGPSPDILDLYRFTNPGVRLFEGGSSNVASYFSLDGGQSDLADYGRQSDPSDFLNSSRTPNDPFNEYYDASTNQRLTLIDLLEMESLGYQANALAYVQVQSKNDLAYSNYTTGNHFIDLVNFEASYNDLVLAFGWNSQAMQSWYNTVEPTENRPEIFDGLDYVASYSDLISAFKSDTSFKSIQDAGANHYIVSGLIEGRSTTFNGLDYVASYLDLAKAIGVNSDAGAWHFIKFGFAEGRTTNFDGLNYIAGYRDLIRAFGANEQAGAAHFISCGINEGRATIFDGLSYIANYADLMKLFGANTDAGAAHYITNGLNEGRSAVFNSAAYEAMHPDLIGAYANNDQFLKAYISTYAKTGHLLT